MTKFVVDASVWIEYLQDTEKGRQAAKAIESEESDCFTPASVVAEVTSKAIRSGNLNTGLAFEAFTSLSTVSELTREMAAMAGHIHSEIKKKNKDFGMLDAFVVATARKLGAKILTCDSDFKGFKETIMI